MKKKRVLLGILVLLSTICLLSCGQRRPPFTRRFSAEIRATPSADALKVRQLKIIVEDGGRVDWSHSNGLIAFDRLGGDGYYDVWVMNPDGSNQVCLTCDNALVPQHHNGNPAWHPTGKWIVFQSVNPDLIPRMLPDRTAKMLTQPGSGWLNDLWVIDPNGKHFYQLTHLGRPGGVLHPHFSHNGSKLLWAERLGAGEDPAGLEEGYFGEWALKVADFVEKNGVPQLGKVATYQPGEKPRFYESHGFSLDDAKILFSANPDEQAQLGFDIYSLDLPTQKLTRLTHTPDEWDEHSIISPDGTKIVWMSSQGIENPDLRKVKADFWIMNSDGSEQQRLTYFNDSNAPDYVPISGGVVAADSSWSPDGTKLVVNFKTDRANRTGPIAIIEFGQ